MSTVLQTGDNVLGAVIFFSYIISALLLTGLIVSDIVKLISRDPPHAKGIGIHERSQSQNYERGKLKAIWMLIFATIGFAQLSWNMLGVLVISYQNWALRNGISYPRSLVGEESIITVKPYIWVWATQSTLFRDFAEDLLKNNEVWTSVQLPLIWTMLVNVVASFCECIQSRVCEGSVLSKLTMIGNRFGRKLSYIPALVGFLRNSAGFASVFRSEFVPGRIVSRSTKSNTRSVAPAPTHARVFVLNRCFHWCEFFCP